MILTTESIDDYHANPALSKSKLMTYKKKGPAYFHARYVAQTIQDEDSPSMAFGRLFDAFMENPELEVATWADPPSNELGRRPSDRDRNAKKPSPETLDRIAKWDAYLASIAGKKPVELQDRDAVHRMADALYEDKAFADLWPLSQKQVTSRHQFDRWGLALQARPDGLTDEYLLDIKTIYNIDQCEKQMVNMGYHIQMAIGKHLLALDGRDVEPVLCFVESDNPCPRTCLYKVPDLALEAGWNEAESLAGTIAWRYKENKWRNRRDGIQEMKLSGWVAAQLQELVSEG